MPTASALRRRPPLRAVGRGYVNDTDPSAAPSGLPVQLVSNGLSLGAHRQRPERPRRTPAVRPAPAPEPPRPQTSAGLPTRIPGTSFNETTVESPTIGPIGDEP